jgi:hypothetical protein
MRFFVAFKLFENILRTFMQIFDCSQHAIVGFLHQMCVGFQGLSNGRVPQSLGHRKDVRSIVQKNAGVTMPQIMQTDRGDPAVLDSFFEKR